jgi:hypothetical protein
MTVRYTPKGKYFTEVLRKRPIRATIYTVSGPVEGTLHVHPDRRTIDELNAEAPFLAVTQARVSWPGGETETDFVLLHKDQIVWIIPHEDEAEGDGGDSAAN